MRAYPYPLLVVMLPMWVACGSDSGGPAMALDAGGGPGASDSGAMATPDAGGNAGTGGGVDGGVVDPPDGLPAVTLNQAPSQADPSNVTPIDFFVRFSLPVLNDSFTAADVSDLSDAPGVVWAVVPEGNGRDFVVRATEVAGDGMVSPRVSGPVETMGFGETLLLSESVDDEVTYDTSQPGVTIVRDLGQGALVDALPVVFQLTFDEPVDTGGLTAADIEQTGTATGVVWEFTFVDTQHVQLAATEVAGDGTLIPNVVAGATADLATNPTRASTGSDHLVAYTDVPLGVTVQRAQNQDELTNSLPVVFDVTFTQPITVGSFSPADITVGGSSTGVVIEISNSGDDVHFTLAVTTASDGTVVLSLPAGVVQDPQGDVNSSSIDVDNNTVTLDTVPPTVTIEQATTQADPSNMFPVVFDIHFSEPIDPATLGNGDYRFDVDGTWGGLSGNAIPAGNDQDYRYEITLTGADEADISMHMSASRVRDLAGNANEASTSVDSEVRYDLAGPESSFARAVGQDLRTATAPATFLLTFQEVIDSDSLASSDIVQNGSATGVAWSVAPGPDAFSWIVTAEAIGSEGSLLPALAVGAVTDPAGNLSLASINADEGVVYSSLPIVWLLDAAVVEGDDLSYVVDLNQAAVGDIGFHWALIAGSAEADVDYVAAEGDAVIASGTTSTNILLSTLEDLLGESGETFRVVVSALTGQSYAGRLDATVTIGNDDFGWHKTRTSETNWEHDEYLSDLLIYDDLVWIIGYAELGDLRVQAMEPATGTVVVEFEEGFRTRTGAGPLALSTAGIYPVSLRALPGGLNRSSVYRVNPDTLSLDSGFGDNGDLEISNTEVTCVLADAGSIWIGGRYADPDDDDVSWYVSKHSAVDGALDATFGSAGVLRINALVGTSDDERVNACAMDGTSLYLLGTAGAARVEKRSLVDGQLDASFGTAGVLPLPIGAGFLGITLHAGELFLGGSLLERRSAADGSLVWSVDAVPPSFGIAAGASGVYSVGSGAFLQKRNLSDGGLAWEGADQSPFIGTPRLSHAVTDDEWLYSAGYHVVGGERRWMWERRSVSDGGTYR